MAAVFKTVVRARERTQVGSTPTRLRHLDLGIRIPEFGFRTLIMTQDEMKERTRTFALRIIRLVESLPSTRTADVLGKQLLRSGTSVGANYRSACRGKSLSDFIAKLGIVEEEADESIYWIELLVESKQIKKKLVVSLLDEANQIVSIIVAAIRTSKAKRNPKSEIPIPK